MTLLRVRAAAAAAMLLLPPVIADPASARQVVISEVMSSNTTTLADEDGDYPDWIELRNDGPAPVDLAGWVLTDKGDPALGWVLPARTLEPGGHLVVFASDKDRVGLPGRWTTPVDRGHVWKYRVGGTSTPSDWMQPSVDVSGWANGASGFGYGDGDDATVVQPVISVAARTTFEVADPASVVGLLLHVDYDDGFVAYLNGREVARANLGTPGTPVSWAMTATRDREAAMYLGGRPEEFNLADALQYLVPGANTLAVEVHNVASGSSDLSLIPFLSIATAGTPDVGGVSAQLAPLFVRPLHTDFRIAVGERLCLGRPDGSQSDCFDVPEAPTDFSTGRNATGETVIFTSPTPGAANVATTFTGQAPPPSFSLDAGHVSPGRVLTIGPDTPGGLVVVTTDGSTPGESGGVPTYTRTLTATTVVRARVVAPGAIPGDVVTRTYIVESPRSMAVVSLTTDPPNLWDWNSGIYVLGPNAQGGAPNWGANFWQDWEKPVHVEFFESGGSLAFSHGAGVKIYGGWSRAHPQKSLAMFARSEYGANRFDHRLFSNKPFDRYETFVLRNSGNDWNRTQLRDGYMQSLVTDTEIDWMAYRPAVVYLNGEYWGIQNVREKINEHYVAQNGGVDPDAIDMMDWQGEYQMVAIRGDATAWNAMMDFVRNSDVGSPDWLTTVGEHIDLDNYIDYHIAQIFFDNTDWPGNNTKTWRERTPEGRFRWILYDTDFGFGLYGPGNWANNTLTFAVAPGGVNWPNPEWSTYLLRRLLTNGTFRRLFVNRYADFLNTRFRIDRMEAVLDSLADGIRAEIPAHTRRWGGSLSTWQQDIEVMRQFARNRPDALRQYVRSYFALGSMNTVTVRNPEPWRGRVLVNREAVPSATWEGRYFVNVPVPVTAEPAPGYRFAGWSGSSNATTNRIEVDAGDKPDLTARFEVDPGAESAIVINEIMYHPPDAADPGDWVELTNVSSSAVDLAGWTLGDGDPTHVFTVPAGTVIPAGGFVVLAQNAADFAAVHPNGPTPLGNWGYGFSKGGETIYLRDAGGVLADSVAFTDEAPWPVEADGQGASLELVEPTGDNRLAGLWRASETYGGTPGARNAVPVGTQTAELPGGSASVHAYPNPFRDSTSLDVSVPRSGDVVVTAYDLLGRELGHVRPGVLPAGRSSLVINLPDAASGLILLRVFVDGRAVAAGSAAIVR